MSTVPHISVPPRDEKHATRAPVVDSDRPWPGLFPFAEEQHNYFFGRDDEIDELFHCIKRETITLLFGMSGLGKSSLLQAGVFPLLRENEFLPVYIRLKFSDVSESPISQVKSAIQRAIQTGDFAEASLPSNEESLWEYVHRRGGNVIDRAGRVLCLVLVFDQFEEIFTLGDSSEAARGMRDEFLDCFGQVVENSIPQDLRERLAENPRLAERFDFGALGCRIVVSLREDFLPKLERHRNSVPSLIFATSRMRLNEMNGEQALLAVSCPNPHLLTEKVAERIVRFVARDTSEGQQKLRTLEVPPAILSLFCRELSIKRGAAPQITDELVSGNAATIIDDFYHRCIDDKPAPLRRLVEDKLVTTWGYRDNIDLKQAKGELEETGVLASLIDDLIDERLLHIDERSGKPRIELTHDVLIQPVTRSRENRIREEAVEKAKKQEHEALEKAREQERLALAEAERESKFRRLKTLLAVGTVAGTVLLASLIASVMLWRHAANAEHAADEARRAETAQRIRADDNARRANDSANKADALAQEEKKNLLRYAKASKEFVEACDQNARLWEMFAGKLDSGSPLADVFLRVYEMAASNCIDKAWQLHDLDPNNAEITDYLGQVNLELADSAVKRRDNEAAKDQCVKAVETADKFHREPAELYKTHLVAARTYGRAGYSFYKIKDPRASQMARKGVQVLGAVERRQGTTQFVAGDWHAVALVYFYRGFVSSSNEAHLAVRNFYQSSFEAESKAIAKDPRPNYLKFAMGVARIEGDRQEELGHKDQARDWYNKSRNVSERRIAVLSSTAASRTDAEDGEELASAYSEAAEIDAKLKDWQRAVSNAQQSVDAYEDMKDKSTDDSKRDEMSNKLAKAYGNLAWYELLAGRFEDARKHSERGLSLDPKETWIRVNRAHAMLLAGHVAEAQEIYLSLRDARYSDRNLVDDVKNDFQQLCNMNVVRPEMGSVAKLLGIDSPQLNTCLTAAAGTK